MKVQVRTHTRGLVHSLTTTDAATADITQLNDLLHGQETTLYGDKAYWKESDRQQWTADGGTYRINRRGKRTPYWDAINRTRSTIRARCERVFHVMKTLRGFAKVRYRGLEKNTVRVFTAFARSNLYLARHKLLRQGTYCRRERRRRGESSPRGAKTRFERHVRSPVPRHARDFVADCRNATNYNHLFRDSLATATATATALFCSCSSRAGLPRCTLASFSVKAVADGSS